MALSTIYVYNIQYKIYYVANPNNYYILISTILYIDIMHDDFCNITK